MSWLSRAVGFSFFTRWRTSKKLIGGFIFHCSFFGQSFSLGHYPPIMQPPEGVNLLNIHRYIGNIVISRIVKSGFHCTWTKSRFPCLVEHHTFTLVFAKSPIFQFQFPLTIQNIRIPLQFLKLLSQYVFDEKLQTLCGVLSTLDFIIWVCVFFFCFD